MRRIPIEFTDDIRGLSFVADVIGDFVRESPGGGDNYHGFYPGEGAHFDIDRIEVSEVTVWGTNEDSEYGLDFKTLSVSEPTLPNLRGWNHEILERCEEAIQRAVMARIDRERGAVA